MLCILMSECRCCVIKCRADSRQAFGVCSVFEVFVQRFIRGFEGGIYFYLDELKRPCIVEDELAELLLTVL